MKRFGLQENLSNRAIHPQKRASKNLPSGKLTVCTWKWNTSFVSFFLGKGGGLGLFSGGNELFLQLQWQRIGAMASGHVDMALPHVQSWPFSVMKALW